MKTHTNLALKNNPYFYAPNGWTSRLGVIDIVQPFMWIPWASTVSTSPLFRNDGNMRDYIAFRGLDHVAAAQLMEAMPDNALEDRQNNAPTLHTLLQACIDADGLIDVSGYVITLQRFDERITVDGLMLYHSEITSNPQEVSQQQVWDFALQQCHIGDAISAPDEIAFITPEWDNRRAGWWLWWD